MRRSFVISLLIAFGVFAAFFTVEFLLEWDRLGRPGLADMSWADTNNAKLVDILSPMARAYNNVLAMLLATIGLAIPLTANMHTPKLIDMFLRDRINRFVLAFMAQTSQLTSVEKLSELAETTRASFDVQQRLGAASLVGRQVSWTADDGSTSSGTVSAVTLLGSTPQLRVGDTDVALDKVTAIVAGASS